ncbi:MAG: DUF2913 family protein [Vibrio fluvialis]
MSISKNFAYYHNLTALVADSLLHLLCKIAATPRYVPRHTRNEILIKFLKAKTQHNTYANVKKDIRLMLNIARKGGSLEKKLYDIYDHAHQLQFSAAEQLYDLLAYLYDEVGLKCELFSEPMVPVSSMLYMLEEQIEHVFDPQGRQIAPLSILIQWIRAPELIDIVQRHGAFAAELKEWNAATYDAHIQLHPPLN